MQNKLSVFSFRMWHSQEVSTSACRYSYVHVGIRFESWPAPDGRTLCPAKAMSVREYMENLPIGKNLSQLWKMMGLKIFQRLFTTLYNYYLFIC